MNERAQVAQPIVDHVADDALGAREIGFSIPDCYNASAVLFDNLARGNGDRIAVRGPRGTLSYDALCRLANRAGNALLSLGLQRGERVLLLLDDTPLYPAFFFGAIRAGLVPMLINTLSPPDLLQFYLADSGARVIVVEAEFAGQLTPDAVRDTALATAVIANGGAALSHVGEVLSAQAWLVGHSDALEVADTHRDDMAFWMYSSGSTGRPKGVVHLQHDMPYTDASYARHILKLTADDICFSVPKIFFAYGHGNSITFPFSAGASSVLCPGKPDPANIFQAIAAYRPTVFFGLPTLYTALAKAPEAATADLASLRLCISAAEILSHEVASAWKDLSGLEIVEGLGSTEVLHIYLSNTEQAKRHGSAGRRVPGYEIKLIDRDGNEVTGQEGIMCVRGHSTAPLYWNRPDKTAETMRGGWLYTGDRFECDADGFYFFRGRADDLIKVSGQWVYPLEVELCLAEHKAVREVAVLGLELADRRMTLKAYVVPADPKSERAALTQDLQDYVKRTLLPYKYPRIVEFLPELPKTGTGKIDRQALLKREPPAEK
jgi:benzoate-CoA ligase family protein